MAKFIPKELQHAFDTNDTLGDNSKRIYRSVYRRFLNLSDFTKALDMSENKILKLIHDENIPPKSQESLLDVIIFVRRANDASYDRLMKFKRNQLKKSIDIHKFQKNEILKDELPEKKHLEQYIKVLYNKKQYTEYIVNYLLLNYGVRNLDVNLIITTDKDVTKNGYKSKMNYLYVNKSYVTFIRNNYKTVNTYGQIKLRITKKNFVTACAEILDQNYDIPLLTLKNGSEISEESVGRVVQDMTFNKIGEGMYMKVNILDAKQSNNIKRIRELSASRGTSLEEIFNSYDIDNKN